MDQRTYREIREMDLIGTQVVLLKEIRGHLAIIPPGTVGTIKRKSGGLTVLTECCSSCRVQVWATKVQPQDLDLLASLVHHLSRDECPLWVTSPDARWTASMGGNHLPRLHRIPIPRQVPGTAPGVPPARAKLDQTTRLRS